MKTQPSRTHAKALPNSVQMDSKTKGALLKKLAPLLESEGLDLGMPDLQCAIIVQDRMMMDSIHLESKILVRISIPRFRHVLRRKTADQ
jgi:glycine cleavage system regulatory protein